MNKIEVKSVMTPYAYSEYYWVIDGKAITEYLDMWPRKVSDSEDFHTDFQQRRDTMSGLLPAWCGELEWQWENDFVWELIDSPEEWNVPILVCEDDCDLSCIVILVHIRKAGNRIFWERIGRLDHSNSNLREEQQSGILCLEAYTDEDWEQYGDNIATEAFGSPEYWK